MQKHMAYKSSALKHGPRNAASGKGKISRRDLAIINRIVKEFKSRSRVDIDKWRSAIKEAEDDRYPKRVKWGEISKDLDLDNHWSSQVLIRNLAVLCREFRIVDKPTGKENEEKTKLFKAPWFYRYLFLSLSAKFFGTRVVEIQDLLFGNYTKDAIFLIPTENVIPDKKQILFRASSMTGYDYSEDDYIIQIDEDTFMGLLCKAAPQIIWKKNAQQSWAEFSEKFGIPMRYATTNKRDQQTLDRIEKMLDSLGSAARAIFPEGTTVDFKEADTQDAFEVFDKKIERCNSEISKLVNGVTMMSDNGSSLSQSQVHFNVNQFIIKADSKDLYNDVNWNLFPHLNRIGFPIDPLKEEFQWDDTETLGKKDQWAIVSGLLKFYDVDDEWISEQFGVPITGKKTTPVPDSPMPPGIQNKVSEMLEMLSELKDKNQLDGKLADLLTELSANFKQGQSQPASVGQFDAAGYDEFLSAHGPVNAALPELEMATINSLFLKAAKLFFDDQNNKPSALSKKEWSDLYSYIAEKMYSGAEGGYGQTLGDPDLDTPDERLLKQLRENMYVFSAFKNYQLLQTLNGHLLNEDGKVREWNDFKALAMEANDQYNINWLRTEYDTAIASAQFQAQYQQWQEEAEQFDLMFQTVGDDRVRESHADLDGLVAEATAQIVRTLATPLAWKCRCEWVQIPRGSQARTDLTKVAVPERPKGLSNKPGEVFTQAHPYYEGINASDKKALKKYASDEIKKLED